MMPKRTSRGPLAIETGRADECGRCGGGQSGRGRTRLSAQLDTAAFRRDQTDAVASRRNRDDPSAFSTRRACTWP